MVVTLAIIRMLTLIMLTRGAVLVINAPKIVLIMFSKGFRCPFDFIIVHTGVIDNALLQDEVMVDGDWS
jgi:hypothetical protein